MTCYGWLHVDSVRELTRGWTTVEHRKFSVGWAETHPGLHISVTQPEVIRVGYDTNALGSVTVMGQSENALGGHAEVRVMGV